LAQEIRGNSHGELRMHAQQEVDRLEGKVNPAPHQANSAMARARQQIFSEKFFDPIEHLWVGCRMESMAAIVHVESSQFKTSRVSADVVLPFEQSHLNAALRQFECGS
jgi:hypothetical protein